MTDEQFSHLSKEQFNVCRLGATEAPFSGKYYKHNENGMYVCAACGAELFSSDTKFESGSGWPSFWQSVDKSKVKEIDDFSHGMHRIEVKCANCDSHLGHVFPDGPNPTGMRYCINSLSLDFKKN